MKSYLFFLFYLLSNCLIAQKFSESFKETEFTTQEITFKSEGEDLSGTIYNPLHPVAAFVLVHGSGQEKRMEKMAILLAQK